MHSSIPADRIVDIADKSVEIQIFMYIFNSVEAFHVPLVSTYCSYLKGVLSQGFRGFLAQTILKLVVANLIHPEHYL